MKSIKFYITILVALLPLTLIKGQLTNDSLGCVPLLVHCNLPNTNGNSILWDFGDGAVSTIENASHVYVLPGNYTLKLYIDNTLIKQQNILIYEKPQLKFSFTPDSGCAPLSIAFHNMTEIPTGLTQANFFWDFGDGGSSTLKDPIYTYINKGKFGVTLNMITNIAQCNSNVVVADAIVITGNIDLNFDLDSLSSICEYPRKAYFKNLSIPNDSTTYYWEFGNGLTSNQYDPLPTIYNTTSNVIVSLSAKDKDGCEAKIIKEFFIENDIDQLNVALPDTICLKQAIDIIQLSPEGTFIWDFGSEASYQYSYDYLPLENKFLTTGSKEVYLTYTNKNGCQYDTTFRIHVPQPNANFTIMDSILCALPNKITCIADDLSNANYYWNNQEDGPMHMINENYIQRDSFYYHDSIFRNVILVVIDKSGCIAKLTKKYKIIQPNALFTLSQRKGIVPYTVRLKDLSESYFPIAIYIINWGDGTIETYNAETIKEAKHTYEKAGNFYINMSIESINGCKDLHYGMWIKADTIGDDTRIFNFLSTFELDTIIVCTGQNFKINNDSFPSGIDNIHLDFGDTEKACDNTNTFFSTTAIPGLYNADISFESKGITVTRKQAIIVKGAKAKFFYKINCDDQLNIELRDSSYNATNTFFVIDKDTIVGQPIIQYRFADYGKHYIKFLAVNYQDSSCGFDTVSAFIDLQRPEAIIDAPNFICQNQSVMLSASKSRDAFTQCDFGYNWQFSHKDIRSVITDKVNIEKKLPIGKHTISLEIKDVNGCRDTAYHTLQVIGIRANFEADQKILCDSMDLQLKDISLSDAGIKQWIWDIADAPNAPIIKYNIGDVTDSVTWKLTIIDSLGCTDTLSKTLHVSELMIESKIDSILCAEKSLLMSVKNLNPIFQSVRYQWVVDQAQSYSDSILNIKISKVGWHRIALIAKDQTTGCRIDTAFNTYIVPKPEAVISPLTDSLWCSPKTIQFYGQASVFDEMDSIRFLWSFSNGHSSFKINPAETFNKGQYVARLITQSLYGCSDTIYTDVKIVGPKGLFDVNNEILCNDDALMVSIKDMQDVDNFYWDFGDGTLVYNKEQHTHQYAHVPPSGKYNIALILQSNKDGCEFISIKEIKVRQIKAEFDNYNTCDLAYLPHNTSVGASSYQWQFNNAIVSLDSSPDIALPQSGKYNITLIGIDSQGICKDTFSAVVNVLRKPVIDITDIFLCGQDTATFLKNEWTDYTFTPNNIVWQENNYFKISVEESISLLIQATADSLCHDQKNIQVTHEDYVYKNLMDTLWVCNSSIVIPLAVASGDSLVWNFDHGSITKEDISCLQCTQPILSAGATGQFQVNIKNTQQCTESDYHYTIATIEAQMPNVFSPNGDQHNELFGPVILPQSSQEALHINQFTIWNRWGNVVYDGQGYWDGMYQDMPASEDVYYYTLIFELSPQCQRSIKGNVTLIR